MHKTKVMNLKNNNGMDNQGGFQSMRFSSRLTNYHYWQTSVQSRLQVFHFTFYIAFNTKFHDVDQCRHARLWPSETTV